MKSTAHPDTVLIIDFGSQVTQLIARRVREAGVYCEIVPFQTGRGGFRAHQAEGASSSPAARPRRIETGSPRAPAGRLRGGRAGARHLLRPADDVRAARRQGRGRPPPRVRPRLRRDREATARCSTASGRPAQRHQVWMSHGDRVTALPRGLRGRRHVAKARPSPSSPTRRARFYGVHVPPRGRAHAGRREAARATSCTTSPASRATGPWPPTATQAIDDDPQPGRQGQGDLRPVGRRRLLRRGAC